MTFKPTKRFWIHLGAGTVACIALAIGVSQCSSKDKRAAAAEDVANAATRELHEATATLQRSAQVVDSLLNANKGLTLENEFQADSIIVLNDSIAVLNDSLTNVNNRLADCERGKRCPGKRGGTQGGKKRTPVARPASARTPGQSVADSTIIALHDNSRNDGKIIANGGGQNVNITLGNGASNSGQIIVNNGGTVNNTVNILQNASDTLSNAGDALRRDTLAAAKKKWISQSATASVMFVKQR